MGSFKSDVLIAAPSERVFAALTDLDNAPKLLSGIGEVQLLTPGPLGKGSRFRETRTVRAARRRSKWRSQNSSPTNATRRATR